jgi:hypothetical protein
VNPLRLTAASPCRVENLGKVAEREAARGLVETGKVEEDVGFHRGEEGEARRSGGLVEELGLGDLAVGALGAGFADNELDQVHFLDHVLKGAHVGVRHLAALRDVAQRVQVVEQVVRELVLGRLHDDALKLLGLDEAVAVLVEELKGLADALALQPAQHLRELLVVHAVALGLAANVQLGPLAVPVKGDAVGPLVELVQPAKVIVLDGAEALDVEEAECDLVLGVGLAEEVLKVRPVAERHPALVRAVRHAEEDRVLLALDLVLLAEAGQSSGSPELRPGRVD